MSTKKVWLVTGASKGLGLVLAKKLLKNNYRVAATSRTLNALKEEISDVSDTFLPLATDVTDDDDVKQTLDRVISHFGQIDVVVNNAGYGQFGTLEELSDSEVRQNYEVNVFGYLNVVRHAIPFLRKQQSGHVFNISSAGGYVGNFPGWGVYCSTKFAVSGFTEALAEEMRAFGVYATIVYPGYFRTNFLSEGSVMRPTTSIEAYTSARESEKAHFSQFNGHQAGDPEKAAEVLIEVSEQDNPVVHLFLGSDAFQFAETKISTVQADMKANERLSKSTEMVNAS